MDLFIDIETYSGADLLASGVYRYAEHPDFRILMAAWSLDGGPVTVAIGHDQISAIPGLWDPDVRKVAHNAQFERVCLSRLQGMPTGTYLPPQHWHDTMAAAAAYGYPQRLDTLAQWLGGEQKDTAGTRLISLFCKPNRKGERNLPPDHPDAWEDFVEYCRQDVATLIDVHNALGELPGREREVYVVDQLINDTGMAVDVPMARAAVEAADDNRMLQELEVSAATGVANPGSRDQLLAWLAADGLNLPDLRSATVSEALAGTGLTPTQRRVLEIRQDLALAASKKYQAALDSVGSDGRLRGGFRFFGAHTGRWAGRGVQPHNLAREQLPTEADTDAAILDLKMGEGASAYTLKALVRALFTGPLTVVDYAAIEARVLAWLAGEQWALDAFANKRDIYVETAERMGGLTRTQGKVAVLALGYNGGVNSLRVMGAEGSDAVLQPMVDQWRRANPNIVRFWRTMDNCFRTGGRVGELIRVEKEGRERLLVLPSGRAIHYHGCAWDQDGASFRDPKRPGRVRTYGGRLTENVTQAVARDVLADALCRLHRGGYPVVGHVHDEILVAGKHSVQEVSDVMTKPPAWAAGLPIAVAGFTCRRYRKD